MRRNELPRWVPLSMLLTLAVAMGCTKKTPSLGGLPECPASGDWSALFNVDQIIKSSNTQRTDLSLPGAITNVPEFHDCQQFVSTSSGRKRFTSLFAIFARFGLDSVLVDSAATYLGTPNAIGPTTPTGVVDNTWVSANAGIPMAEIYSFEDLYLPLGIQKGFNCLYIYPKSGEPAGLEAKVIPVAMDEASCTQQLNPHWSNGTVLAVTRLTMVGANSRDYPPVARWDWDARNNSHYIGIRCGNAWCEIGPKYTEGRLQSSPLHVLGGGASQGDRRVTEIKGWYDEQHLAIAAARQTDPLEVGSAVGTLIPEPSLGDLTGTPQKSAFTNKWQDVASIAIQATPGASDNALTLYHSKLNLEASSVTGTRNIVSMCFDSTSGKAPNRCVPQNIPAPTCSKNHDGWWAQIKSVSGTSKYYCVVRRSHEGIHVPGVVRWRWAIKDETIWARCLEGCCEVEANAIT